MPSSPVSFIVLAIFFGLFFAVIVLPIALELQRSKFNTVNIALFIVFLIGGTALLSHGLNVVFKP